MSDERSALEVLDGRIAALEQELNKGTNIVIKMQGGLMAMRDLRQALTPKTETQDEPASGVLAEDTD